MRPRDYASSKTGFNVTSKTRDIAFQLVLQCCKTSCVIFCRIFNTILLSVKAIAIGKAEELVVVL